MGRQYQPWPNHAVERTGNKLALVPRRSPPALIWLPMSKVASRLF